MPSIVSLSLLFRTMRGFSFNYVAVQSQQKLHFWAADPASPPQLARKAFPNFFFLFLPLREECRSRYQLLQRSLNGEPGVNTLAQRRDTPRSKVYQKKRRKWPLRLRAADGQWDEDGEIAGGQCYLASRPRSTRLLPRVLLADRWDG